MVMLHIKLKEMKCTLRCSHVPTLALIFDACRRFLYEFSYAAVYIVAGNLFVVHFSIDCKISELYILRNSWSLAQTIMSFPKDKEYDRILYCFLFIDSAPQKKREKNQNTEKNNERMILHVRY